MSLSSLIARTEFALAQTSLTDQDRLDIIDRALAGLDHFKADTSAHRTRFLQLRAATLATITADDIDALSDTYDDLQWSETALRDSALSRSLSPHL